MDSVYQAIRILFLLCLCSMVLPACTKTFTTEVDEAQKIDENDGNFSQTLSDGDHFASSVANLGDIESDGVIDLAVGVPNDDDGGSNRGAVWVLFMDDNGQVDVKQKISASDGNFSGSLDDGDQFGFSVAALGDLNNDGFTDIAVGAPGDDEGGTDRGAIWILFLDANGRVLSEQKIANQVGGLADVLNDTNRFGAAIANIGDINKDGIPDLAVGAPLDDDGGTDRGALWILFMNRNGSVASSQKISSSSGGFAGELFDSDHFASSITAYTDLDNNGVVELVVGTPGSDTAGSDRGAIWLLYLDTSGQVIDEDKIAHEHNEFDGSLKDGDAFGSSVVNLGDLNNDGISELAIGASGDDDGGTNRGAVWILFLRNDATVISSAKISSTSGNFSGRLSDGDGFGAAIASLGDLDRDGITDMAVGASQDNGAGTERGALWVLFMSPVSIDTRVDKDADLATLFGGG